nr:uncharacterized protein LOC113828448 [Penaeus vannamei]
MSAAAGPQRRGSSSRPTSASSRPPSSASRPTSAPSRPTSAASRLSAPARPLLRSQTQAETAAGSGPPTPLPAQVDDPGDYHALLYDLDARGHYFIPPVIPPLYDRAVAAPTPMSTRCNTPVWDLDGEKRVRFLEPEVVGDTPSRPPSVTSQYSQVLKNSARFLFQPSQALTGDPGGHNPRYCNCPCHFFPSGRKSVGIQVKRTDPEPPRPRHYRLFFTPTMRGLEQVNFGTKSVSLATRAVFSQVGLAVLVVAWWVAGAAIFSTVEGAAESKTVDRMASLRTDLVLGLATELRQVLPYDLVWRTKIETYMGRLENAVLDAARAGYASRAPTWTMSGALLYSASLTTLVGPGGMTLRTGFSRIFAVLFSLGRALSSFSWRSAGLHPPESWQGMGGVGNAGIAGRQSPVSDGRGQESSAGAVTERQGAPRSPTQDASSESGLASTPLDDIRGASLGAAPSEPTRLTLSLGGPNRLILPPIRPTLATPQDWPRGCAWARADSGPQQDHRTLRAVHAFWVRACHQASRKCCVMSVWRLAVSPRSVNTGQVPGTSEAHRDNTSDEEPGVT